MPPDPHTGEGLRCPSPDLTPPRSGTSRLPRLARGLRPLHRRLPTRNPGSSPKHTHPVKNPGYAYDISLEWVKLETSNLVCSLNAKRVNQTKCKSRSRGRGLRHVTYSYNFGTHSVSVTGKATDFKFCVRINRQAHKPKNGKVGQKGRVLRNVTYFYNFVPLLNLSNG